jgi:hypothetical protein
MIQSQQAMDVAWSTSRPRMTFVALVGPFLDIETGLHTPRLEMALTLASS